MGCDAAPVLVPQQVFAEWSKRAVSRTRPSDGVEILLIMDLQLILTHAYDWAVVLCPFSEHSGSEDLFQGLALPILVKTKTGGLLRLGCATALGYVPPGPSVRGNSGARQRRVLHER